jgi:hypothetical protein
MAFVIGVDLIRHLAGEDDQRNGDDECEYEIPPASGVPSHDLDLSAGRVVGAGDVTPPG